MLASAIPNRVSSESHECSHSNGRVAFEVDEIIVSRLETKFQWPSLEFRGSSKVESPEVQEKIILNSQLAQSALNSQLEEGQRPKANS